MGTEQETETRTSIDGAREKRTPTDIGAGTVMEAEKAEEIETGNKTVIETGTEIATEDMDGNRDEDGQEDERHRRDGDNYKNGVAGKAEV